MGRRAVQAIEVGVWTVVLTGLWVSTLTVAGGIELAVAAGCSLGCALLATGTRGALDISMRPRLGWLTWVARLPAAVVGDLGRLAAAVTRTVRHDTPLGATRRLGLPGEDPRNAEARRALGSLAISATPGSFVVDVTTDGGSTLILHALSEQPSPLERTVAR